MTRIIAAIGRFLTSSGNGAYDKSEDVFKKYIALSLLIHLAVLVTFSISYSRAFKPPIPTGPYEVSLVQFDQPRPEPQAPKRTPPKEPEPKPTEEKPKVVVPEEKKEEAANIKPEAKKPEAKKPEPKPKEKPAETEKKPTKPQDSPADSLVSNGTAPTAAPSVGGFQVDNPSFNFNYYLATLRDKIQRNWRPPSGLPPKQGGFSAVIKFTIRRDGTIAAAGIEQSSGLTFFDQSALRAVVNSNPAPPLPRAYDEDRLGVHVSFVFDEENQ